MLIFIQRGTSVPFFLRFFRGCCGIPACHSERRRRVFEGARRVSWVRQRGVVYSHGMTRRHIDRKRNIPLRKNLFCSFLSFCCDQKERNATKERKNAAKTKSGIFLLKLWKSLCSTEFQQKNSDFVIGWEIFIRPHFERSAFPRHYERKRRVFERAPAENTSPNHL